MKKRNNTINISHLILFVLIVSFCAIIYKLCYISLAKEIDGINLTEFVKNRNTDTEPLRAERGSIYSNDNELLAKNVNSYIVVAILDKRATEDINKPRHVVDIEDTAAKLSVILNMDIERLRNLLSKKLYQVELRPEGAGISEVVKRQIEELNLPGITFIATTKRYYQMGSLAPYIIGFASQDDNENLTGKMGIEAYYDEDLEGEDGYIITQKDLYGYTIPNTTPIKVEAKPGKDIYLTLDSRIQMFLENGIQEITSKNHMEWLTFSVIDAKTGAIVGSASNPTFNLNKLNIESYLNPLTSYAYEPGSTMKIFSFMAAMENGKYNGSDVYKSGTIKVEDAVIQDFNGGVGWGTISFDEGFAYSSNVAATNLALKLGRDKLHDFYENIGFGKKTGITLPGEVSGKANFIYRTELATASFGQGITTTPIQNLQALTILTNDGVELQPYIVDKIVDSKTKEVVYKHKRTELGKKANSETVKKILSLMYDVVYSEKTDAKYYKNDSVTLIGKTGTAQIANNGSYLGGKTDYIRSFAGIFPYDNPQYIIYVSVKQYDGVYKDFAAMVKRVVEEIAKYKNITDHTEVINKNSMYTLDNYVSKEKDIIVNDLISKGVNVITLGDGKYITKQYPAYKSVILPGDRVFLVTSGNIKIPDFNTYSRNDVITLCKLLNIKYVINGNGKVISQSIPANTDINSDMVIEFQLG